MARQKRGQKTIFVCQSCGYDTPRWAGRCPNCGEWNTLVEEKVVRETGGGRDLFESGGPPRLLTEIRVEDSPRITSSSREFDRVLGGGLVPGSLILLGGDPGIGKSTLVLQQLARYALFGRKVLYVSGEESLQQVRMRSLRLQVQAEQFWLYSEVNLHAVLSQIEKLRPEIVAVDSIQTMFHPEYDSAPGSVTQVRENTMAFLQLAKSRNITVMLIGHVTKEGMIAGPRVLEHMVDVLLYLEGDRQYQYRILRGIKNRFGSTNEIAIFELIESGLREIENPSHLFLSDHRENVSGTAVTCAMEGTRPILLEIQALTASASFGVPQRTATGIDHKRLALLLAILEKRAGFHVGAYDVFVKIAGGLRLDDPSADLAILQAMAAGFRNVVIDSRSFFLGEVGLGGEVRSVSQIEARLKEADALGFTTAYIPKQRRNELKLKQLQLVEISDIHETLATLQ